MFGDSWTQINDRRRFHLILNQVSDITSSLIIPLSNHLMVNVYHLTYKGQFNSHLNAQNNYAK